jgi:hypothetical protein
MFLWVNSLHYKIFLIWFLSTHLSFTATADKNPIKVGARYINHIKYSTFIQKCKDLQSTIISMEHQAKLQMKNQVDQVVKDNIKKDTNTN